MESWVLKLFLVDQPDQPLLLHISRKSGGHQLDLDLIATDNEHAYRAKVRQRKLESLRSDSYEGTAEEWSNILIHAFVSRFDSNLPSSLRDSLEVACSISDKGRKPSLRITLRTRVEDITHKLGVIDLSKSDTTDDVDLFAWTALVVDKRDTLSFEVKEGLLSLQRAEKDVAALKKQLEELVEAKAEHESQLLSKFTLLLNEKKLRIRAQQREIAHPHQSAQALKSSDSVKNTYKRKAIEEQLHETDEDSDGFEAMDLDQPTNEHEDTQSEANTPSATSDTDTDNNAPQPQGTADKGAKPRKVTTTLPPRRELPFANKAKSSTDLGLASKKSQAIDHEEDETASEDDEL